jgi:16S rRNA (uracil1498-N3)-methyltransferase
MRDVELIIGPEGDFSKKEYELLNKNKVQSFNLGQRRLRSETASLASLSILNSYME